MWSMTFSSDDAAQEQNHAGEAVNKRRQERRDRPRCYGMGDSSLEDRERGQPEGERAMQVHAVQAQRATSTRKRKERKWQRIKRGEGRREPERGERWRQRESERGGGRKRAGRAIEGRRSSRQMAVVTATQKREKEGEEGRERREEGQCTAQKSGRGVYTKGRPNRRSAE
jgi:hypothetical protein